MASLAGLACERAELPAVCPEAGEGEIVVSELRGEQADADTRGQWIELFNSSGRELDLRGLVVRFRPLDGREPERVLVRADTLIVAADGYVVLGRDTTCSEDECVVNPPPDSDYGFGDDFVRDFFAEAIVEIEACEGIVDTLTYRGLPPMGTRSFDGAVAPDASNNDDAQSNPGTGWCDDTVEPSADGGPVLEVGVPGTPGEANRPCP